MTADEIAIVQALSRCSFTPGTAVKRFIRTTADRDTSKPMTEKGRAFLWKIAWSYRRQLSKDMVELARQNSGEVGLNGATK